MIDWNNIKQNTNINIIIIENNIQYNIVAELLDYDWSPHREPLLANIIIKETNEQFCNVGDILKLPIITKPNIQCILLAPKYMMPNNQIIKTINITLQ